MKIRTDFVTNSSSSSFILNLYIKTEKNIYKVAYSLSLNSGTDCEENDGGDVEPDLVEKHLMDEIKNGRTHFRGEKVTEIIREYCESAIGEDIGNLDDTLDFMKKLNESSNLSLDESSLKLFNQFLKYDVYPNTIYSRYTYSLKNGQTKYTFSLSEEYDVEDFMMEKCIEFYDDISYCPNCGEELDEDNFCQFCEEYVEQDSSLLSIDHVIFNGILDDLIYGNKGAVDDEKSVKNKVSYLDSKALYRYTPDKITRCGLTQREVLKYFTSTENYYVNSHVEVEFDDYQRAFYNCKVPVRIGSIVIVDKENTSVKAMVINILGKFVSNTKLITKKYVPTIEELKNMPNLTYYLTENQKSCVVDGYNQSYDVIIIPDTYKNLPVIDIANDVFKYKDIKEITFSKNIKIIREKTIFRCKKLEKIVFSHGVEQIENYAICNCDMLKCIELPKSLKSIGENALNFCNVEEIYYNGTLEDWKKIKIVNYNNFLKSFSKLYVLDETGDITYNDKKYKLYIGPRW